MKSPLLYLLALSSLVAAESTPQRLSRQELLELRAAATERNTALKPQEGSGDKKHPSQNSILVGSDILRSGGYWTFVPKGALLIVPEAYKTRVNNGQGGDFITFTKFAVKNRGWLTTHEVTLEQARGNAKIDGKVREVLQGSGRVVISTLRGGAITVRPPKSDADLASK